MKRTLLAVLLPLVMLLAATAPAAAIPTRYGMDAKTFAAKINCHRAYDPDPNNTGAPKYHIKSGVVCWLRGYRVNVITFRDRRGQTNWENDMYLMAAAQGRRVYWASSDGVTIIAKHGGRPAACAGGRALGTAPNAAVHWMNDTGYWAFVKNC